MQGESPTSASFKANVSVNPTLSHSVLVALLLVAVVALIAGCFFLWHEKNAAWVPFSIFFFLIALTGIGWWRSQKSIDMGNAVPTKVLDRSGNQIFTDSRVLESVNAIENIGLLLQSMGVRQPLPEPDGVISSDGEIVPDSKSNAINQAKKINENIERDVHDFMLNTVRGSVEAAQTTPQLPDQATENIAEHNKAGEDGK